MLRLGTNERITFPKICHFISKVDKGTADAEVSGTIMTFERLKFTNYQKILLFMWLSFSRVTTMDANATNNLSRERFAPEYA